MGNDNERMITADELPADPFAMPPPHWRSGGAARHVRITLDDILSLLEQLIPVHERTNQQEKEF